MILFGAGMFVGAALGVLAMALCVAASDDLDEHIHTAEFNARLEEL